MKTLNRLPIGSIAVDSGKIVILDPANLDALREMISRRDISLQTEPAQATSLELPNGVEFAIVADTRSGDGSYPAFIETEDGHPRRIVVEFSTEFDDAMDGLRANWPGDAEGDSKPLED